MDLFLAVQLAQAQVINHRCVNYVSFPAELVLGIIVCVYLNIGPYRFILYVDLNII
jgi:hypothetical protein